MRRLFEIDFQFNTPEGIRRSGCHARARVGALSRHDTARKRREGYQRANLIQVLRVPPQIGEAVYPFTCFSMILS